MGTSLKKIINNNLRLSLSQVKADQALVLEIQQKLNALGLYPGGKLLDGDYGSRTEAAIKEFCVVMQLNNMTIKEINAVFATTLLNINITSFKLESAKNKQKVYQEFLAAEAGFKEENCAFLNRGIAGSLFQNQINNYPQFLQEKPELTIGNKSNNPDFENFAYPVIGKVPTINEQGLKFLDDEIKEACICIGSFVNGEIKAKWLGRNALSEVQFWSATKFIPILNIVCQVNKLFPDTDIDNCVIRSQNPPQSHPFFKLALATISYNNNPASSNSIAAMFKRFSTFSNLESWARNITGNSQLRFSSTYGENAFIDSPELIDKTNKVLLKAAPLENKGANLVSAYDLTRLISMLGWHNHLPENARLAAAKSHSLESVIRAMGNDSGRYIDVAIARLGLEKVIQKPVIISKVGWGRSDERNRYEITYTAFLQFIDNRSKIADNTPKLRTLAMTLRAAKNLNNPDKEATELDARVATEVTEIIRRVVTEELA